MKYEKPTVEIIRFDNFENIMTSSAGTPMTWCPQHNIILESNGISYECTYVQRRPIAAYEQKLTYYCGEVDPEFFNEYRDFLVCTSVYPVL